MTSIEIPAYVDPAVLQPGTRVVAILDPSATPLEVVSVEPALIVKRPNGELTSVLAHEVLPLEGQS